MKDNYYITINSFNPINVIGWPQLAKSCIQNKSFKILFDPNNNYHIKIKSDLTNNGIGLNNFLDSKNIPFYENDIIVNLDKSNTANVPIGYNCKVITSLCGYKRNCLQDQLNYIKRIKPFKVYTEILEDEYFNITSTKITDDILDIMYFLPPYINGDQQSKELEIIYENKVDNIIQILLENISLSSDNQISLKSIKDFTFNNLQNKLILNLTDYPQLSHISNSMSENFNFLFYSSFINPLRISKPENNNNICFINDNEFENVREKFTKYLKLFKNIKISDIKSIKSNNNYSFNFDFQHKLQFTNELKLKTKSNNKIDVYNNSYKLKSLFNYISDDEHYNYCFLSFIITQYKFGINTISTKLITKILKINHSCLFSYLITNNSKFKNNKDLIYSIYHSIITNSTKDSLII